MKRTQAQTIGQIMDQFMREEQLDEQLDRCRAAALWPQIVGDGINRYTVERRVNGTIMTVRISSAPLRNELTLHRSAIISRINEALGREVITDIIFR